MRDEILAQMQERYQDKLLSKEYKCGLNSINDSVKNQLLEDLLKEFVLDLKETYESETNKIYFLTRRDVYQISYNSGFVLYDNDPKSEFIMQNGSIFQVLYGDIYTNIENSDFWYFLSKEDQKYFIDNNLIVNNDDCSLYYLAQKDFFKSAVTLGQEEAKKKVLSKKY